MLVLQTSCIADPVVRYTGGQSVPAACDSMGRLDGATAKCPAIATSRLCRGHATLARAERLQGRGVSECSTSAEMLSTLEMMGSIFPTRRSILAIRSQSCRQPGRAARPHKHRRPPAGDACVLSEFRRGRKDAR